MENKEMNVNELNANELEEAAGCAGAGHMV